MVEHLEFLVEEPSMEALLEGFLPRVLGNQSFCIHVFQGKQDLLRKLPNRLKAYAQWLPSNSRIIVLVDRDQNDCKQLKQQLDLAALQAGLTTRTHRRADATFRVLNRIVIEELEAWYFGDWNAVRTAYPRAPLRLAPKYRESDSIQGGTWQAFERIMVKDFRAGLNKIEAARTIAPHLSPERTTSRSFRCFCAAITELINQQ